MLKSRFMKVGMETNRSFEEKNMTYVANTIV